MMSKGNKVNFTHIIVNCMGKHHVDFFLKMRLHYCIIGHIV